MDYPSICTFFSTINELQYNTIQNNGIRSQSARCEREAVVRSFVKCGIAVPMDRSRDSKINIETLSSYKVVESHDVEAVDFYESSDDAYEEDEESLEFSSELPDTL